MYVAKVQKASEFGSAAIETESDAVGMSGNVLSVTEVMTPKVAPPPYSRVSLYRQYQCGSITHPSHSPEEITIQLLICRHNFTRSQDYLHLKHLVGC